MDFAVVSFIAQQLDFAESIDNAGDSIEQFDKVQSPASAYEGFTKSGGHVNNISQAESDYSDNFNNAIESIVDLGKEMTESAIGGIPTSTQDAVVGGVTEVVNQVTEQTDEITEEKK